MKRIRQQSWLYVVHESEIPNPGDFKSFMLAQQPIIVVRDGEGQVRVLLNICRHRQVTVCRQATGNTMHFTCADHGWVYNTKGSLIGLSGSNRSLRNFTERRGLIPVPRMDIYQGVIFASLGPEGESLDEYLHEFPFFAMMSTTKRKT